MIKAKDCDVLLFAAGFGKRLLPLTQHTPKPLLLVHGKPLIEWNLLLLSRAGFNRVFINLHYLGSDISTFVKDGSAWGLEVSYSEEPILLDTGGGIKNIESRLKRDHLVTVNSDTLVGQDFSFEPLLTEYAKGALAALVVREDAQAKKYGSLRIDERGEIIQFLDASRPAADLSRPAADVTSPVADATSLREVMYAGIQVLSRDLIASMPKQGSVFSITKDTYRTVVRSGGILRTCRYDGYWSDVGTPERLELASKSFSG